MASPDKMSGKDLPTRPSDDAIIRTLTSLQRSTQVKIIKRMIQGLPTAAKVRIFKAFPWIVATAMGKVEPRFEG
jgi:hypothetical protein